uniref:Uncharacterized protein n=1 Tax=Romanomermis culicivorax TaxID=13658 RepID=A0A915HFK6_ROMCU
MQKSDPKKSPKRLNHAFGQLLTAPEVMEQLKVLKEAKKTKKVSSANKCRICFIAWLNYKKKFKANWAECDECDGRICGNCLMDDFDDEADFACQICVTRREDLTVKDLFNFEALMLFHLNKTYLHLDTIENVDLVI